MSDSPKRIHPRKRQRVYAMQHAYERFHTRHMSPIAREVYTWMWLLEWARLGGKPDEVIR